jgi:hypothetical protein
LEDDDVNPIEQDMGCGHDVEKNIFNDLTALFEEVIQQWKLQTFGDAGDLLVSYDPVFKSHNMFSRADIPGAFPFGKFESSKGAREARRTM